MIIELSKLHEGGELIEGEESAAILDLGDVAGLAILSPIRYRLMLELVSGELVVRGTLSCRAAFDCSRCARRFETEIRVPDFIRVREYRELAEAIDLTEDMREDMILAFPNYPVCSSGCRGLCPQCGADLNEKTCSCRPPAGNQAWDALDQITRRME
jgi:uncharacterized protein